MPEKRRKREDESMKETSEVTVVFMYVFLLFVYQKYKQTMRPFLFKIEIIIYANLVFQILKYAPPDTFCYNRSVSENLINFNI